MKSLIKFPAILLGLFLMIGGSTQVAKAQYEDVSLQTFYDELSPYGTWINDPQYGYVWRPDVDQSDFRPYYTNGRWAMTEYGNTWVSNYDWGWAPFHYGRWIYNRYNSWVWIPDTTWGPAWVNWRSGGGHYGWAPMTPNIGIHVNVGIADFYWNFLPYNKIYHTSYPRYYSGRNRTYIQNTIIINNTYVRNNRTYYTGPRIDDIRRHTNQRVTVYDLERTNRNGVGRIENNRVNIYTPRPTRGVDNANAAPRQAIAGNINRDRIERNGTVTRDVRDRGNYNVNDRVTRQSNDRGRTQDRIDRGSENSNRPERQDRSSNPRGNGGANNETVRPNNPTIYNRSRERVETNTSSERVERKRETRVPTTERRVSESAPQRTERVQQQRTENRRGDETSRPNRESGSRPGRG